MSHKFALMSLMLVLIYPHVGNGQEMTEKYIPIGTYPKLAAPNITIGTIVDVDKDMKTIALQSEGPIQRFLVADATMIWLDRSLLRKANGDGTFADLRTGVKAEVAVLSPKEKRIAKWIKVQVASQ